MALSKPKAAAHTENSTEMVRMLAGDVEHAAATFLCNPNHDTASMLQAAHRAREVALRELRATFSVVATGAG
jgi:hypothetical protein